ncbi:MAG: hypothetical protein GQ526_06690 [Ardenticatenales bacterium]|nr:hypothetical protein [Ardenticatenales bacterium]
MRARCHWLALTWTLLAAVGAISLTLLAPRSSAEERAETSYCAVLADPYCSPQCCGTCHAANLQSWSDTAHASASVDPLFLVNLQLAEEPRGCLGCHSTGYDPSSGHYALAGVTCEACHRPYQPGHSSETMAIVAPAEICGECHTDAVMERESAAVRHQPASDASCTSCHSPHSKG